MELLHAMALDDRMKGNDTYDQTALDLSPPDTNVPRVASGFYQRALNDYLSRCSHEEYENFFGCSFDWGDDHSNDENREVVDDATTVVTQESANASSSAVGWNESITRLLLNGWNESTARLLVNDFFDRCSSEEIDN